MIFPSRMIADSCLARLMILLLMRVILASRRQVRTRGSLYIHVTTADQLLVFLFEKQDNLC